jgi:hypothetical protein
VDAVTADERTDSTEPAEETLVALRAEEPLDPIEAQAAEQSDAIFERKKDPEY